MAHFYGVMNGSRGEATRCGTKGSGMQVTAASWEGAVQTNLWHDPVLDKDMCEVFLREWHGNGTRKVLYHGPVSGDLNDVHACAKAMNANNGA